jgi:hypothetical protein
VRLRRPLGDRNRRQFKEDQPLLRRAEYFNAPRSPKGLNKSQDQKIVTPAPRTADLLLIARHLTSQTRQRAEAGIPAIDPIPGRSGKGQISGRTGGKGDERVNKNLPRRQID